MNSISSESRHRAENTTPVATELLLRAEQPASATDYLNETLPLLLPALSADLVAVTCAGWGNQCVAQAGLQQAWPTDLVAECLDRESPQVAGPWLAAPLSAREHSGEVLLLHRSGMNRNSAIAADRAPSLPPGLESIAAALGAGLRMVRARGKLRQRATQAETILSIVQQWGRPQEMETLLNQMAEASTQLLEADRASIFLWDRANHLLVGRPALGVASGELRVPDDAGVVGEVLRTEQPQRISHRETRDLVNRRVDTQLGYQTRTLVAVPLRSPAGELLGVFEVINKRAGDFTGDDEAALVELASHAAVALENVQDRQRLLESHRQMVNQAAEDVRLLGNSPAIEALRSTIRRVADTDLAVLVLGENGTGKEVVSQLIHYRSPRRDRPFVAVNCAAIAETLLESELFGHEKGAFTDAHESRPGKFELAAGGTLLLDEIGDLSPGGQSKLLRVLEEKVVVRVGGSKPIPVDVRVLAATNQSLTDMVRARKFRQDLFFRLNVVVLELPPLRDRGDDILLLAEHFLSDFCRRARRKSPKFSAESRKRLLQHPWPGNVRELRNLMERLAFLVVGDVIEPGDLAFILSPSPETSNLLMVDQPLSSATDRFQIEYIHKAIGRTGGNMSDAADLLGLHRSNLYRKMKQLGMESGG
ncbi:MAG TPA: sigma-54-dependent Fis family transcriptional regulator [Pirellulales bacterium]|nr:sigma-54-dependent Fis family transcriptional regulator [Pirellulales bacterium]